MRRLNLRDVGTKGLVQTLIWGMNRCRALLMAVTTFPRASTTVLLERPLSVGVQEYISLVAVANAEA